MYPLLKWCLNLSLMSVILNTMVITQQVGGDFTSVLFRGPWPRGIVAFMDQTMALPGLINVLISNFIKIGEAVFHKFCS